MPSRLLECGPWGRQQMTCICKRSRFIHKMSVSTERVGSETQPATCQAWSREIFKGQDGTVLFRNFPALWFGALITCQGPLTRGIVPAVEFACPSMRASLSFSSTLRSCLAKTSSDPRTGCTLPRFRADALQLSPRRAAAREAGQRACVGVLLIPSCALLRRTM